MSGQRGGRKDSERPGRMRGWSSRETRFRRTYGEQGAKRDNQESTAMNAGGRQKGEGGR